MYQTDVYDFIKGVFDNIAEYNEKYNSIIWDIEDCKAKISLGERYPNHISKICISVEYIEHPVVIDVLKKLLLFFNSYVVHLGLMEPKDTHIFIKSNIKIYCLKPLYTYIDSYDELIKTNNKNTYAIKFEHLWRAKKEQIYELGPTDKYKFIMQWNPIVLFNITWPGNKIIIYEDFGLKKNIIDLDISNLSRQKSAYK